MKLKLIVLSVVVLTGLLGFTFGNDPGTSTTPVAVDKNYLRANLTYLASDEVGGREAGTVGEKLAADFIASELDKYGVKPFGDNGTYFNNFTLLVTTPDPSAYVQLLDKKGNAVKNYRQKMEIVTSSKHTSALNTEAQLVFAGYGIDAPEYGYNDYQNLDVKGKIVLVLDGEPSNDDPKFFDGKKATKYARVAEKINIAVSKGAVSVITTTSSLKRFSWSQLIGFWTRAGFSIDRPNNTSISPYAIVPDSIMSELLGGSKYSLADLQKMSEANEKLPVFSLNSKVRMNIPKPIIERRNAKNVIGIIEGTDPVLKNEYVAVSAHYDHDGTHDGEVYNGADDDGSGTVGVLEIGRLFAKNKTNKRSVLVVFHTAEEKGLLGSEYLSDTSPLLKNMVGLINMDMIGRESVDSIHVIGSDRLSTEYHKLIVEANKRTVNMTMDFKYNAPNDPNRFYFRSDHFNYARKGVPIVFFFDDMRKEYHRPTDDVHLINFDKIAKVATLSYSILEEVANLDHRLVVDGVVDSSGR